MSKRLENFAYNYVNNLKTKGNAYKSAVEAGYSPKYSHGNAHKLVEKGGKIIKSLEETIRSKQKLTKEKKLELLERDIEFFESHLVLTRLAYDIAEDAKEKKNALVEIRTTMNHRDKLLREHGELMGDYVKRTDTTVSVTDKRKEELEDARKQVNQRLSTLN